MSFAPFGSLHWGIYSRYFCKTFFIKCFESYGILQTDRIAKLRTNFDKDRFIFACYFKVTWFEKKLTTVTDGKYKENHGPRLTSYFESRIFFHFPHTSDIVFVTKGCLLFYFICPKKSSHESQYTTKITKPLYYINSLHS